ncbi:MAG: ABC transporter ATP-binding protein [Actinobacteria bacterium]|nr:ABC transporter ATP-binding protein [Actinomycetota bacterium]
MLEVRGLTVRFGDVEALCEVDLTVADGPCGVAIVGESGSGKTTLARAVLGLVRPAEGSVVIDGVDVACMRSRAGRRASGLQLVPQNTDGALNPRMRVGPAIEEVLRARCGCSRSEARARVRELLVSVGLSAEHERRWAHELSGGQRQRVAIVRALAAEPRTLVLDEPTSGLDLTVQSQILRLLAALRTDRRLAYLLITHSLSVVDELCEDVVVLYLGRVMERGPAASVLRRPAHPYTQALRKAVPVLGQRPEAPPPRPPAAAPGAEPAGDGCVYHARCPLATDLCRNERPPTRVAPGGQTAMCHHLDRAAVAQ